MAGSLATVFLIGYFATSPIFGALADRGARKGSSRSASPSGASATFASGLAHGRGLARSLRARSSASARRATRRSRPRSSTTSRPPSRRAAGSRSSTSATPIGSALGYLVGGFVEPARLAHGVLRRRRPGHRCSRSLCLLIAEPRAGAARKARTRDGLLGSAKLSRVPLYRRGVLGYCAYTFALGGFAYWAPTYLHVRYGMESGHASFKFGLITVLGGPWARWAAAGLRTARRGPRRAGRGDEGAPLATEESNAAIARGNVSVPALGATIGAPLTAAAIAASTAPAFFRALFPAEIALFLMSGPINVALLRSAPPELQAGAMALSIFAIHALGDLWSPFSSASPPTTRPSRPP